eukprot:TRINITY_DN2680_c2_g1_i1.p1 TRINITY_DN2680_c2_g1~~TRINITY_DN2680_c2_g1_i1.p1  ORF type:complete len:168 (+),score=36.54 TRINITY_DN2680_c2_g1_i1:78-506(+)
MTLQFGQYVIRSSEVFFRSRLSMALVNLMPVQPGHVLVIPTRVVRRFHDLTEDEVSDLFASVQKVSRVLQKEYDCPALTIAIQDGKEAGQTVHHVHVHVMPRREGDFKRNDDVYTELDRKDRQKRTLTEMAEEASRLRSHFL